MSVIEICPLHWEKKEPKRRYVRGYNVYMIIWKQLVGEFLQCVKQPTNEVDKNTVAVVCINSHCKEKVVDSVQHKSPWLYRCFYSCSIALWITLQLGNASTMELNKDWKSLQIFVFMNLKRPLNWLKNKITKIKENLKENVKKLFKVKCIEISYKKWLIWPVIGRVR